MDEQKPCLVSYHIENSIIHQNQRVLCFLMNSAASLMSLHVQGQVVRSGEGSVAEVTLEGLGARVLPIVTGQLI